MTNPNYGDLPESCRQSQTARIVVLPVPFDQTSTWVKGADKGPDAIIDASANMELYDIETDSEVYRQGIFTDQPVKEVSIENMIESVRARVGDWLDRDKLVVTLGGEHSISLGAIQAHYQRTPGLSVLQLDAHADLRDSYEGSPYNHACVMARVKQMCPAVQVGIRSMDISEKANLDPDRVFFADLIQASTPGWCDEVVDRLSDEVYITIDLDVFDSSIMPATGTPEPGGLGWYDVLGLVRTVMERKKMVGFDVVELCPLADQHGPSFLAAKLVYKLLSYHFQDTQNG